MPLTTGSRFGPYEILSLLGAGGMGEVYRARDTRLGRSVAIKVLPQHLSASPEDRARLQREAKTISALNHPHICVLHDLGRDGEIDYLVMELVEGEVLAHRLARGPLQTVEVLKLGSQIADALASAHRAGVVHRDLKPGNVMLASSGAKLMDFGLARLSAAAKGDDLTETARRVSLSNEEPITAKGRVVGTFQYMAPEQLEGKPVDARCDIWALGCVLYEMATGNRAFEGSSAVSVISAILRDEPRRISELAPLTPTALEQLVLQCLAKNPNERIQSAYDAKLHLQWIGSVVAGTGASSASRAVDRLRLRLAWGIAGGALLAAGTFGTMLLTRKAPQYEPVRFQISAPAGLFNVGAPIVSPDGWFIAFNGIDSSGVSRVWVRALNAVAATPLSGTEGAVAQPFWSPDSRFLAFFAGGKLKRVSPAGGPAQIICSYPKGGDGSWGRGGIILFDGSDSILSVPASGGVPVAATALNRLTAEVQHDFPWFLPDGKHFLYIAPHKDARDSVSVQLGILGSSTAQTVAAGAFSRVMLAGEYLLFVRDGTLMAGRFDLRRAKMVGDPIGLVERVRNSEGSAWFSVSENGILVFQEAWWAMAPEISTSRRVEWSRLVSVDRSGRELGNVGEPGNYLSCSLSPDEKHLAVAAWPPDELGRDRDIWSIDLFRGTKVRITFTPTAEGAPVWTPDGSKILFYSDRVTPDAVYQKQSSGVGEDEILVRADHGLRPSDISLDGRYVALLGENTIWVMENFGDRKLKLLLQGSDPREARFSPDCRWIAYSSVESGRRELYVQAFPGPGERLRVSLRGGRDPQWRRDGKELFFLSLQGEMMAVDVRTSPRLLLGVPRALFHATVPLLGLGVGRNYAVTADGQRFIVRKTGSPTIAPLTVVLNWKPTQQ
jgi:Tol biopolymer transport system component/tRNA A-37 threonylcarbamoyl transferase component Bud32